MNDRTKFQTGTREGHAPGTQPKDDKPVANREPMSLSELVKARGLESWQWNVLRTSIYPGAKDESILMAVDYCRVRKLDVMLKPVHLVPMEVKDAKSGQKSWRDVPMPGIYTYRTIAHRTGLYLGHSEPEYGEADEMEGSHGIIAVPRWCRMVFYRWNPLVNQKSEFPVKVFFAEVAAFKDGKLNTKWSESPVQMHTKCFDEQTEVLTDRGFRLFSEVADARILEVTSSGLVPTDAKPFSREWIGSMISYDSDDLNFCVTPNHDMVTTTGKIEAQQLFDQSRTRAKFWIPRSVAGSKHEVDLPDDILKLAAAYIADGTDASESQSFVVSVSRPYKVQYMEALNLHHTNGMRHAAGDIAVGASGRVIETKFDKHWFRYRAKLIASLVGRSKMIEMNTLMQLSRRQARVFVDALIEFDGTENTITGVRQFFTSRQDHLRAFELVAVIAGYSVSAPKVRHSDLSTNNNYCVTISERNEIPVRRLARAFHASVPQTTQRVLFTEKLNDTDRVWCVTVPSGIIVVRRNGFSMLCGNCTEAAGLREAFPEELGGTHTEDEMLDRVLTEDVATDTPRGKPRVDEPQPKDPEGTLHVYTEVPVAALRKLIDEVGIGENAFLDRFGLDSVEALPLAKVEEAMTYLTGLMP